MALRKALLYLAAGIGAFVLLGVVFAVVSAIVSAILTLVAMIASVLVLAGLVYGGYKAFSWFRGGGEPSNDDLSIDSFESRRSSDGQQSGDSLERLKQRYAAGEISEAEFERKLELELGDDGLADELEREHS